MATLFRYFSQRHLTHWVFMLATQVMGWMKPFREEERLIDLSL